MLTTYKTNHKNGPEIEWIRNGKTNSLNLINLSLEIGYCNITLSNHVIIKFIRFVSKTKLGVVKWVLALIYI
jgi:hypothetical protein